MATKPLDSEILKKALAKNAETDAFGWANQAGVDKETFMEIMTALALSAFVDRPIDFLLSAQQKLDLLMGPLGASFLIGWYARGLQKDEVI